MNGIERDIGHMEAEIKNLTTAVSELTRKVDDITATLAEARGGWRTLMWVSGASATIGGLIAKFAPWFFTMGPR